jgi:hypothetical protein
MTQRQRTAVLALIALLVTTVATSIAPTPVAALGYDGPCTGDDALDGVTVVVDFQELDGLNGIGSPTIVRCSPNPNPGTDRTGIEALQDAGISVAGTTRWGLGFVCRVGGRPTSSETLPVGAGYTEACFNTPPAAAYWSYWHADGSGYSWSYSSYGAANRMVTPGGYEGWSFSLNKTASTNPPPGEDPFNPDIDPDNPTVSLSVDDLDGTIELSESTGLTWSSTDATTLTAFSVSPATGGGSWSGSLTAPGGTQTITPTATGTYTYTIRANGPNGTVFSTAQLTVVP